jgi:hypothetical protein
MPRSYVLATTACLFLGAVTAGLAQAPAPRPAPAAGQPAAARPAAQGAEARPAGGPARRPGVFLKEEWAQNAKGDEHPVTQESIANSNLELKLYGANAKEIAITGKAGDENNPIHVWTGLCTSPCAVALRDKANMADLSGLARVRWNIKTSGFHQVRPMVKLADGSMYVGDRADIAIRDWLYSDFSLVDVKWMKLDPARVVTTGVLVDKIDLTKVDEIGFADLMPSSGHGAGGWADVAQIEVYGKPVARTAGASTQQ